MASQGGSEPIADHEILFRRVSRNSGWYDPQSDRPVAWEAFRPREDDVNGLSVWRAKYRTPEEVAAAGARPRSVYYVLVLRAGTLRGAGVTVVASPEVGAPGHASLTNLSTDYYRGEEDKNRITHLADHIARELIESVEGPFGPFGTADPGTDAAPADR
jgi:hypothetical protein